MIYLLDTNILIIYIRFGNSVRDFIDRNYDPLGVDNKSVVSVVTIGEIKAIAIKNRWGRKKLEKLDEVLENLIVADINTEQIINRYAEIDAFSQGKLEGRKLNLSARNMGKNDVWIAATASVLGATLLTADNDFNHLHDQFLTVAKINITN